MAIVSLFCGLANTEFSLPKTTHWKGRPNAGLSVKRTGTNTQEDKRKFKKVLMFII